VRCRAAYFLVGAVLGLALGSAVGLLFAPASGARTRQRIADEAVRAADFAREMAERAEVAADQIGGRVDHYLGKDEQVARRKVAEIRAGVARYTQAHAE
jgi:gas vesicle protein